MSARRIMRRSIFSREPIVRAVHEAASNGRCRVLHSASYLSDMAASTRIGAYDVVNARVGVGAVSGAWTLTLWARNVMDAEYYTTRFTAGPFATGTTFGLVGEPRMYGLTLRVSL